MSLRGNAARWLIAAITIAGWSGLASSASARLVVPAAAGGPVPASALREFVADYPDMITIHRGDAVSWRIYGFHTVSFLAPGQFEPPLANRDPADPVHGALDAAGQPFWFNGQFRAHGTPLAVLPSGVDPNGTARYNGTSYLSSGLPYGAIKGRPFVVTFTRTGVFTFVDLVHPGMKGTVRVLAPGRPIPSLRSDRAIAGARKAADDKLAANPGAIHPPAGEVLVGGDAGGVSWLRFFPSHISVKSGSSMRFVAGSTHEVHTITFGPQAYTGSIEQHYATVFYSGVFGPGPTGPPSVILDPRATYSSDPAGTPAVYDGKNHGNGFLNSGLVIKGAEPFLPGGMTVQFTTPGVYHLECVIHPGMDATVTVTP